MADKLEKYDSILSFVFKAILLLFILGLIGALFYALFAGDIWDKVLNAGITVGSIAGIFKLYIKYDIAARAAKNPDNLDSETIKEIVKSLSGSVKTDS